MWYRPFSTLVGWYLSSAGFESDVDLLKLVDNAINGFRSYLAGHLRGFHSSLRLPVGSCKLREACLWAVCQGYRCEKDTPVRVVEQAAPSHAAEAKP